MPAQIQEFRFNDSPWRIDWLGRIDYPESERSEPRIKVYLSELKADFVDPLSSASLRIPHRHEVVTIKVGQIVLLAIGSVWIDGIRALPRKAPHQIAFSVKPEQLHMVNFNWEIAMDDGLHPLFNAQRYRIGAAAAREVSSSWVALVKNPTPNLGLLLIPSTVIFQKCLATSPKAVRRLVYGHMDKIVDPGAKFLKDRPSTYYIELFKDFRDSEGVAMANLSADPIARRELNRFRNTLIVESANREFFGSTEPLSTHVKLNLPFSNAANITAVGKYLAFNIQREDQATTEWGFLVTEITSLGVQLVFDELIIDRKNNATRGDNAGDSDLQEAWGTPSDTQEPSEETVPVTSTDDPAKELDRLALEAAGGFDAIDLKVIKEEKEVQQYRGRNKSKDDDAEPNGTATTGDPHSGHSGTTELDVLPKQAPTIPGTLDQFFEALALLSTQGFTFGTIIVSDWYRKREYDRGVVNFFPLSIKGVRSWHLSSDLDGAPPRGYVVAEMARDGIWHYLIELQRKGVGAHALLHIRDRGGRRIDPRRIEKFMLDVARKNGWSARRYHRDWIYMSIKHKPSKGVESFVQAIIQKI